MMRINLDWNKKVRKLGCYLPFMSVSYSIYDWLQKAFSEPADGINESYYFDKRNNQFYSVFITDYFLTDCKAQNDYPDSPYSPEELALLSERIDRQESCDPSILTIPRLTVEERKELMHKFLTHHQIYNSEMLHGLIELVDGRTSLGFNKLLPVEMEGEWQQFKRDYLLEKIDSFCNLHSINLEAATLWKEEKLTSITLNISEPEKKSSIRKEKPWWKVW